MYVISSLVLVSSTLCTIHLRSLLPVMYVISRLALVSATPYTTSSQMIITCYVCDQ